MSVPALVFMLLSCGVILFLSVLSVGTILKRSKSSKK